MSNTITSADIKEVQSRYYRDEAVEHFDCRHCYQPVNTGNTELCSAQLCEECFAKREAYRKVNPYGKDAERNLFDDQYGADREYISYVCAECLCVYEIVPSDKELNNPSTEELKRHYEATLPFHKGVRPFKPIVLEYKNAPKGWDNNILCKHCYDMFIDSHISEIQEVGKEREDEKDSIASNAVNLAKTSSPENATENEESTGFFSKIAMIVVGFAIVANLFAFIKTLFTEGYSAAGDKAPAGGLVFFIVIGIGWFLLGPYLQDKGYKEAGKLVKWSWYIVFVVFLVSVFLSKCGGGSYDSFELRPPRSL